MSVIEAVCRQHLEGVRELPNNNLAALCPFHDDHDPSFNVNLSNGLFICHACGASGNFYKLLHEGFGYSKELVKVHFGLTLKKLQDSRPLPPNPLKTEVVKPNQKINEGLLGLFHMCPLDLVEKGFHEDTLLYFGVGFDKWHQRITFPLRDVQGNLVGISGRAIDAEVWPRYKVYDTEYTAFDEPRHSTDKRLLIWHADVVYPDVYSDTSRRRVVIVEGFKAAMWVWQAGFKDVLALMGMRMSYEQKLILERMGAEYILLLDNNDAGREGTRKIGHTLQKTTPVRVGMYDAEQPDAVEPARLLRDITNAIDFTTWSNEFDNEKDT